MKTDWLKTALGSLQSLKTRLSNNPKTKDGLEEVCVFPLPNIVLIPGTGLPLHIFEERYKLMMDELLSQNLTLAMSMSISDAHGNFKHSKICGAGQVAILQNFPDGRREILVQGERRLQIVEIIKQKPYIKALARLIPDELFDSDQEEILLHQELISLVRRWIFLSPQLDDSYMRYVDYFSQPHQMADFIASIFLPTGEEKQRFLEKLSRKDRVSDIMQFIQGRIDLLQTKDFQSVLAASSNEQRVVH